MDRDSRAAEYMMFMDIMEWVYDTFFCSSLSGSGSGNVRWLERPKKRKRKPAAGGLKFREQSRVLTLMNYCKHYISLDIVDCDEIFWLVRDLFLGQREKLGVGAIAGLGGKKSERRDRLRKRCAAPDCSRMNQMAVVCLPHVSSRES